MLLAAQLITFDPIKHKINIENRMREKRTTTVKEIKNCEKTCRFPCVFSRFLFFFSSFYIPFLRFSNIHANLYAIQFR